MLKIKEVNNCFFKGTKYEKYREGILIDTINVLRINKIIEGFEYIILIASNGKVIKKAYQYLNVVLGNEHTSKRNQAASALKAFFSFLEIVHIRDCEKIGKKEYVQLKLFLEGGYFKGMLEEYFLESRRCSRTFNIYMGVYRDFFKTYYKKNDIFSETRIINSGRNSY